MLAWNAHAGPGASRPSGAVELQLVRRVAARRWLGRPDLRRPPECRRAPGRAGPVACPGPRARRGRGATAAGGGVGRRTRPRGKGRRRPCSKPKGVEVLRGVKTFCSGAGGLDRALVLARQPGEGPPLAVWIDLTDERRVEVDTDLVPLPRTAGIGLASSRVSRRAGARHASGRPGALAEQPWFARDALRTAASWAGMADTAVAAALDELAQRPGRGQLEGLAAGRILTAQRTIDAVARAGVRARWTAQRRGSAGGRRCTARVGDRRRVPRAARRGRARMRLATVRPRRRARSRAARPRGVPAPAPARSDARPDWAQRRSRSAEIVTADVRVRSSRRATAPIPIRGTTRPATTSAQKYEATLAACGTGPVRARARARRARSACSASCWRRAASS